MQTNFFQMCQIQMEFRKNAFQFSKNCFQLHGVLFETIQEEITEVISKETAYKSNNFFLLYQHSVKYVMFQCYSHFFPAFFQMEHHVLMTLKLQKKMQHVSRNEKRSDL